METYSQSWGHIRRDLIEVKVMKRWKYRARKKCVLKCWKVPRERQNETPMGNSKFEESASTRKSWKRIKPRCWIFRRKILNNGIRGLNVFQLPCNGEIWLRTKSWKDGNTGREENVSWSVGKFLAQGRTRLQWEILNLKRVQVPVKVEKESNQDAGSLEEKSWTMGFVDSMSSNFLVHS